MKDYETQEKFILMRSQGATFARIAAELKVAPGTLVNWSRKFQFQINNLRAIQIEAIQEQLISSRETRARLLTEHLQRVEEELTKRDLTHLSTGRLFGLANSLRSQIERETRPPKFVTPVEDIPSDEKYDQIHEWNP